MVDFWDFAQGARAGAELPATARRIACSLARVFELAPDSAPAELAAPSLLYAAGDAVTARPDPAMAVFSGTGRARPRLRARPAKRLAG